VELHRAFTHLTGRILLIPRTRVNRPKICFVFIAHLALMVVLRGCSLAKIKEKTKNKFSQIRIYQVLIG